jgi:hypothetical protein
LRNTEVLIAKHGSTYCESGVDETKRPQSYDRGLLVKEGEGKESQILYA